MRRIRRWVEDCALAFLIWLLIWLWERKMERAVFAKISRRV